MRVREICEIKKQYFFNEISCVKSKLNTLNYVKMQCTAAVRDGQLCDVAPCCTVEEAQLSYSCSFFVVVVRLGEEFSFPNKVDHIIETIFNIYYQKSDTIQIPYMSWLIISSFLSDAVHMYAHNMLQTAVAYRKKSKMFYVRSRLYTLGWILPFIQRTLFQRKNKTKQHSVQC